MEVLDELTVAPLTMAKPAPGSFLMQLDAFAAGWHGEP
jgi:hypothetical protein